MRIDERELFKSVMMGFMLDEDPYKNIVYMKLDNGMQVLSADDFLKILQYFKFIRVKYHS